MVLARATLESDFLQARRDIFRATQGWAMRHWLELDLTAAQLKTLHALKDGGSATIGGVAEILGITLPTASHLVDKLVHAGYVERVEDPEDRRRTAARPTARGAELMHRLQEGDARYMRLCLDRMSDEEVAALVQGMQALARVAGEVGTDPALERERTLTGEPAR